ncbi:DHH family phosphoesterase [Pediococcus ethanolidurans]|uniref:Exopolyphosphatase-related protein n=1 Tax=Pediococcus ethanolidurans TaxID=319653 RepID=A0A0R2K704_9LACO|nr:bifunctional oligoribonuclease/PAP phosphatase NrnA [Pediococcus ethanolidurans]KRN82263.1 exopolyphosphatase-related protein [Pediococcus ethanolidurans]GEN95161.1 phosphoesterase [Pediococcus ethanolidurans]SER55936.1 phosphoesterase RecJ domain-containing protein [Pediococcus ethanolidurans]
MNSKIMALIKAHQRIFIYRHVNPDPDAIGSQAGLARMLRISFPKKQIFAVGSPSSSLAWISTEMSLKKLPTPEDLVIVVDCANLARIDGPMPVKPTIKIDHHPNLDPYAQINWVQDGTSSCAELIYELYQTYRSELSLDLKTASSLYAGIIGDTVGFSTADTTSQTFMTAAALRQLGVDVARLSQQVTAIDTRTSQLYGFVMSNVAVNAHGLGCLVISQNVLKSFGLNWGEEDPVVSLPGKLEDVKMWLMFIESPDNRYRVHLRSKSIPVDGLARQFAGGGHPLASGTYVNDLQEVEAIIQAADKLLNAQSSDVSA